MRFSALPRFSFVRFAFIVFLFVVATRSSPGAPVAHIVGDTRSGPATFALKDLQNALQGRGYDVLRGDSAGVTAPALIIELATTAPADAVTPLRPEGFALRVTREAEVRRVRLHAADSAGAMYGALELAEIITTRGIDAVRDADHAPHTAVRGVKFNLPLDARSPSYTDPSDTAQQNIATVWEMSFWREFIDQLARNRYNLISLWNLHPFPSLVRVPEYPDVALADVQRSKAHWKELYPLQATGLDAPEILGNVETLRRMTIDEKIAFWREVMRYGRERNVKFYIITWNVFTNGIDGKYGITPAMDNETTVDYFRRSVRELLLTYPDLEGVGFTAGEHMPDATATAKEEWAFRTYGRGVLDALERDPRRHVTFVHRQHEAAATEIARVFAPLMSHPRVEFTFSFKYAEAHALSSTRQNFHARFVADIGATPTLWTVRNDDNYVFRWGAPAFVRDFLQNMPAGNARGFYYGSDQWIWGREFLDVNPAPGAARPLEIAKHAYHWQLWGRLGYDPTLGDEQFIALLAQRFPGADAKALFAAWQDASMIYPLTTGFHWGALDFQWYIEACQSRPESAQTPTGFHDVNRFISLGPHPASGNLSISDYVKDVRAGKLRAGTTPLEVAAQLQERAARALATVDTLAPGGNEELWRTLEDIRAMAHLGSYYGHKIRAATELALYRATHEPVHQRIVAAELNQAAYRWRCYAATALTHYRNPIWMNRVGHVDWRKTYASVLHDLTSTGSAIDVPSTAPTPGGTILEAEDAETNDVPAASATAGFTGSGYRDFNRAHGTRWIEWSFDAPNAGKYLLEVRYAMRPWGMRDGDRGKSPLLINGTPAGELVLWGTAGLRTWAWDRKLVELPAGKNTIRLYPHAMPNIDHLNIVPVYVASP